MLYSFFLHEDLSLHVRIFFLCAILYYICVSRFEALSKY